MSFQWLAGVDLLWAAVIVTALYVVLLSWVITRPRAMILRGAPTWARWRDLRLWIVPLILTQMVLHWLLR